ncbi:MAG: choice-of-anchor I family protein [Deltaproteobacteria bacterium]|nr:choice-of-anchor I family protein [Deltaproteobacteria bacterium]
MKFLNDRFTITLYAILLALLLIPSISTAAIRFAVFADPHYYDNDLGTTGAAFEAYLQQDRKMIRESEAILQTVVDEIIDEHNVRPMDFVIVPGDLTKDGELSSHQEFASYLGQIEEAGIPVFVIPGNHDINNPHAFAYDGETATPVDNVSPDQFTSIYGPYGYNDSLSRDFDSLSYAVQPVPGVILLGLDSCLYENNLINGYPETVGSFSASTLEWAADQIKKAGKKGNQVIAFMHHGLMEHYQGQKTAFPDYVIEDWETVSEELADAGLQIAFTGHYHANDITVREWNEGESRLYDVETGSLVTAPCPYRIVTLHGSNAAQIETRTIKDMMYYDTDGVPFTTYARNYLYEGLLGIAQYTLMTQYGLPQAQAEALAPVVADAFAAHYAGDENADPETMAMIMGFLGSSDPTVQFLGQSLYSLWSDLPPSDNMALLTLNPSIKLSLSGTYETGIFDEGAAEIAAFDSKTKRLFVSNADLNTIDILNAVDPSNLFLESTIDMAPYGGGVNSVAVNDGILAAAVEAENKQYPGKVVFFSTKNAKYLNQVSAGALPDMLTFTPDGRKVLVANEGEPNDDYTIDPEGSVTIIDISRGVMRPRVKTADFSHFNKEKDKLIAEGVRIFGPNASVAQDLEPEYITVSPGSAFAWVSLQENNAIACLNLFSGRIIAIQPLDYKDLCLPGNGIDASDKDNVINIDNYNNLFGMYLPDAIDSYMSKGKLYIVTANEGDARDYDAYSEEERIADLDLDPVVFPNAEDIQKKTVLGRLKVTVEMGDSNLDGMYENLYAYGARSFSIFRPATEGMELVFDSGDMLEQLTAAMLSKEFNSDNSENGSFDSRSDDKGPEPEGMVIGQIGSRTYLFLGLERISGIMVFDISSPYKPEFVQYINNRDFSGVPEDGTAGDLGPEGLIFIPASKSPNGKDLLAVANEVSGSTSIYQIDIMKKQKR